MIGNGESRWGKRGYPNEETGVFAPGSMFGILPIMVIFLLFQKYLIESMTAGAVKG